MKEHPEAKDRVFKPWTDKRSKQEENEDGEEGGNAMASGSGGGSGSRGDALSHLYDEEGRLRDPKKSLYYDAVYNPFGVPPPGMPYRQRSEFQSSKSNPIADKSGEEESEDEEEDSDEEIIMPEGPPPDEEDSDADSDDSDDIPLPAGPPPPKPQSQSLAQHPIPVPIPFHSMSRPSSFPNRPPPQQVPFGHYHQAPPVLTAGFRPPPAGVLPARPPPSSYSAAPTPIPATNSLPPRPGTVISSTPTISSAPTAPVSAAAATISAAPVMRDLRKETTVFVPRGLKRKKGVTSVNAAPGGGEVDADGDERRKKRDDGPGLMGKLQGVLGDAPKVTAAGGGGGGDDDYQEFLKGLGDLA